METSILNILREELIGKEIKIYKHSWSSTATIYSVEDLSSSYACEGHDYVKITGLKFGFDEGDDTAIVLSLGKSEFIYINSIYIKTYSKIELKEKED